MKYCAAIIAALCGYLPALFAQVSVEIVLPQDRFLPAEEMMVGVRVVNWSGQTLQLGDATNWIRFTIERVDGGSVRMLSEPPVQRPFELESAKQATLRVDLAPCYDLREIGRYQISAEVMISNWSKTLTTKAKSFEIIRSTRLWEKSFGVPKPGASQPPELRNYSLQEANLVDESRLYLAVSRPDGSVIRIINVGRMLSFALPEPLLDRRNWLHMLRQNGPRSSEYLAINPEGEITIRQLYDYVDSRPRLRMSEIGDIKVVGGVRRYTAGDIPEGNEVLDENTRATTNTNGIK
jgi:hypothetical protein